MCAHLFLLTIFSIQNMWTALFHASALSTDAVINHLLDKCANIDAVGKVRILVDYYVFCCKSLFRMERRP